MVVKKSKTRTLGLDIGTNSIGWALVDSENQEIVASGVRIFPEGVDRDTKGGELSKNESRRIARGMRRQIRRRSRRKRQLREALIHTGLWPQDPSEQAELVAMNPYELRSRSIREKLTPFELGRVFLHLNRHRGFLSNRKADRAKKDEASEMLVEISALAQKIQEAGHQTLGEHLATSYAANPLKRIRGQHTRREMLQSEFETIWIEQQEHHPHLLTDQLKHGLHGSAIYPRQSISSGGEAARLVERFGIYGIIFFQRPMYWPKSVVGQCELDPKKKRCPRADRSAQRFRILQEVNNLKIITADGEIKHLSPDRRKKLLEFLGQSKEVTFDQIRKKLGLLENDGFNLEAGDRKKLLGMSTDALLASKKFYGKDWYKLPEDTKNDIVRSLIHDNEMTFLRRAAEEFRLESEMAERLLDAPLPEGYSSYAGDTIERLLPYVEKGLPLISRDGTPCAVRLAGFLPPWERDTKTRQFLPEPPKLTNPIVRQAMFDVRKLINAIVREFGKPGAIHIELAREVKGSGAKRAQIASEMRRREARRDAIARRLQDEYGEKPTRAKIERYILWEEQCGVCIYSGREISVRQLLGGEVDMDHILPYSKSLDDSMINKVICFRTENAEKGQRTVHEWLAAKNPEKYEQVLQRAAKLPIDIRNRKRPKFSQKTCELEQFINRQLSDTAYISSAVVEYVNRLGSDVLGSKGQLTAELRYQWGLNDILRNDGLNLKNRDDHRHHAIDAIVIALTNRVVLQLLAKTRGEASIAPPWDGFRDAVTASVTAINVSYRVRRKIRGALHKDFLFGNAAHDIADFATTENDAPRVVQVVRRKALREFDNTKQIEKIRDAAIRKIIEQHLVSQGIDVKTPGKINAEVWEKMPTMKSGVPILKVRMIEQGTSFREIRTGSFAELSSNHHIAIFDELEADGTPKRDKKGNNKRIGQVVPMIDVARTIRDAQRWIKSQQITSDSRIPIEHEKTVSKKAIQAEASRRFPLITKVILGRYRFAFSLSINEMFLLKLVDGTEQLHRVQKISDAGIILRPHTYAGKCSDTDRPPLIQRKSPNTLTGRKVIVDLLGRIRWAND